MTNTIELHLKDIDARIGKEALNDLRHANGLRIRVMRVCEIVIAFCIIAFAFLLLSGCGKSTLSGTGVYGTNQFLFEAEKAVDDSKDALSGFLSWEELNRSILASNNLQSVIKAADSIRVNAPLWFTNAVTACNLYSNAVALAQDAATIVNTSNSLAANITLLQTETMSARAITNSVK